MTGQELIVDLKAKLAKSTRVVGWWAHPREVRGPFDRWFTVSEVDEKYKDRVAAPEDDVAYAAAAMNGVPELLKRSDALDVALESLSCDNNCQCNEYFLCGTCKARTKIREILK